MRVNTKSGPHPERGSESREVRQFCQCHNGVRVFTVFADRIEVYTGHSRTVYFYRDGRLVGIGDEGRDFAVMECNKETDYKLFVPAELRPAAIPPDSVCNDGEPLDVAGGIRR